ncbi:hypothetical protein PSTT_11144 [Puccinia striiformis]|uniref:Uncharacterized protein n=1 Tax=Puccinia striiformis TaxID=27350 RepID=A0A2S4V1L1_9BASI|nr:hypothetical protein PSTT_11144 [Puccinia striiformis]
MTWTYSISHPQDYMDLDEDYKSKSEMELCEEWTTPEHPAAWENWNTTGQLQDTKPDESHYLGLNACSIAADYVDQGYPYEEFLRLYPESYGSTAGDYGKNFLDMMRDVLDSRSY